MASYAENLAALLQLTNSIMHQLHSLPAQQQVEVVSMLPAIQIGGVSICHKNRENPDFDLLVITGKSVAPVIVHEEASTLSVRSTTFVNKQNILITDQVDEQATFQDTVSFGFKEGIKVGAQAEFGFNIGLANASISVHSELSFEANQQITKTQVIRSGASGPVPVPAHHSVDVSIIITKGIFSGRYTAVFNVELGQELRAVLGGRNLAELAPNLHLELTQTGVISGIAGYNWQFITSDPKPIPTV